jgi:hypothetical protein
LREDFAKCCATVSVLFAIKLQDHSPKGGSLVWCEFAELVANARFADGADLVDGYFALAIACFDGMTSAPFRMQSRRKWTYRHSIEAIVQQVLAYDYYGFRFLYY